MDEEENLEQDFTNIVNTIDVWVNNAINRIEKINVPSLEYIKIDLLGKLYNSKALLEVELEREQNSMQWIGYSMMCNNLFGIYNNLMKNINLEK